MVLLDPEEESVSLGLWGPNLFYRIDPYWCYCWVQSGCCCGCSLYRVLWLETCLHGVENPGPLGVSCLLELCPVGAYCRDALNGVSPIYLEGVLPWPPLFKYSSAIKYLCTASCKVWGFNILTLDHRNSINIASYWGTIWLPCRKELNSLSWRSMKSLDRYLSRNPSLKIFEDTYSMDIFNYGKIFLHQTITLHFS